MSYQDRYKGRKIKDPPSYFGRFGLFILVGAAFAAFVGCLRGLDSSICALATLTVVACKLLVELIATRANFKLPERFAQLPLAVWLLFWLLPIPPLWFVLRTVWPASLDPNGAIGTLTILCLVLYIPTIMAVMKPVEKTEPNKKGASESADQEQPIEKVNFNIESETEDSPCVTDKTGMTSPTAKSGKKTKSKGKKQKN